MLESMDVTASEPIEGRPYEWVLARATYSVDPSETGAARIADLALVPCDDDGRVRFSGDLVLLRPTSGGNGRSLLVVPNRGMAAIPFSDAGMGVGGTSAPPELGDGYLLDEGWTIALPGWQWDVPAGLLGLAAPRVEVPPGWMRADLRIEQRQQEASLAERYPFGGPDLPPIVFDGYPTVDVEDPDAVLRVRTSQLGAAEQLPRSAWRFTSPTTIELDGGFLPQRWYELIYRSATAPVVGTGLLAVRDVGAHLAAGSDAVVAYGQSQCGRFLREFLHEGLNLDEHGERIFVGVFAEIAGARRGEFNRRFAKPGLLSAMMPEYGPPYGSTELLARQRELGGVPKTMLVNSAAEYWRGDGALVHQDAVTGADLPEDPDVRTHLLSGTDHIGDVPIKTMLPGANPPHFLDPGPVLRALFVQLQEWALDGVEPTPSQVPRASDGSAVTRDEVLARVRAVAPDAALPDAAVLPFTPAIDPGLVEWPLPLGEPRVALVSAVDATGNEVAGIRLPAVEAGIAAFTGWNPRRHVDGLPDALLDMVGSRLPVGGAAHPDAGSARADLVREAAVALVERRLLLPADLEAAVAAAMRECDATQPSEVAGA